MQQLTAKEPTKNVQSLKHPYFILFCLIFIHDPTQDSYHVAPKKKKTKASISIQTCSSKEKLRAELFYYQQTDTTQFAWQQFTLPWMNDEMTCRVQYTTCVQAFGRGMETYSFHTNTRNESTLLLESNSSRAPEGAPWCLLLGFHTVCIEQDSWSSLFLHSVHSITLFLHLLHY